MTVKGDVCFKYNLKSKFDSAKVHCTDFLGEKAAFVLKGPKDTIVWVSRNYPRFLINLKYKISGDSWIVGKALNLN